MRFNGADSDVTLDVAHPEFSAWAWMAPVRLVEQIVPFKRAVYDRVFAEFGSRI